MPTRQKDPTNQGQSPLLTRRAAYGVIVRVSSIRPLLSINDAESIVETRPSSEEAAGVTKIEANKVGPKKKKFNYAPVLAKLQSEILSGAISRLGEVSGYGVQAKLEREIAYDLTDKDGLEPSESTVRRRAQELMKAWEQHPLNGPP